MNIEFLTEYFVPVISGICLCVGYVIKTSVSVDNKYIPAINAILGLLLAVWLHIPEITPDVILSGMFSGLAATGLYEAFRNLLGGEGA